MIEKTSEVTNDCIFGNKKENLPVKFGLLVCKNTNNIGDDVQSYAAIQFLPHIHYIVDRENMDTFQTQNNESVAVIMNAWYMHNKWNFPPSPIICPNFISVHISEVVSTPIPIVLEFLDGIGGDYLRTYAPIGTRDTRTLDILTQRNIPAYFSGCLTLTLPKQKIIEKDREYICLVDLNPDVHKIIIEIAKKANIDVKIMTMKPPKFGLRTNWDKIFDSKKAEIEEILTIYQNAKCVITSRLHVSLPCLAMETPVFTIFNPNDPRFQGLAEYLNIVNVKDFLDEKYKYDFINPPPNKPNYLPIRHSLIENCKKFIEKVQLSPITINLPYNEQEKIYWQFNLLRNSINKWQRVANRLQ